MGEGKHPEFHPSWATTEVTTIVGKHHSSSPGAGGVALITLTSAKFTAEDIGPQRQVTGQRPQGQAVVELG